MIELLRAAVAVDGGVTTEGRAYAGPGESNRSAGVSQRYNAAISHRLEAITTIRAGMMTAESGCSVGYSFRPGDSDTNRAKESHGHFAKLGSGFYEAVLGVGEGCNDLIRAGNNHRNYRAAISMGDAPIGTIQADSGCVRAAISMGDVGELETIRAGGSTWDSGCGCSEDGIGTVQAVIEIL